MFETIEKLLGRSAVGRQILQEATATVEKSHHSERERLFAELASLTLEREAMAAEQAKQLRAAEKKRSDLIARAKQVASEYMAAKHKAQGEAMRLDQKIGAIRRRLADIAPAEIRAFQDRMDEILDRLARIGIPAKQVEVKHGGLFNGTTETVTVLDLDGFRRQLDAIVEARREAEDLAFVPPASFADVLASLEQSVETVLNARS